MPLHVDWLEAELDDNETLYLALTVNTANDVP